MLNTASSIGLLLLMLMQSPRVSAPNGLPAEDRGIQATAPLYSGSVTMTAPDLASFDQAPVWIRDIPSNRVGSLYPVKAIQSGLDGAAEVRCVLTVDGALSRCAVASENPAGVGFASAAMALMSDLNLKPASKAGRPVATPVVLKVAFLGPGTPTGSILPGRDTLGMQRVMTGAVWTDAPSYADVVAAYPALARAAGQGGKVTLYCTFNATGRFQSCELENEEPQNLGFAEAARTLSARFQVAATGPSGKSVDGLGVKLPFVFTTRMLEAGKAPGIGRPTLVSLPSATDMGKAFPAKARAATMLSSDVMIDCAIAAGGSLTNCKVAQENPAGFGFGEAALSLAPKYQINPWSNEGLPMVGGRVRVPVKYQLKLAGG